MITKLPVKLLKHYNFGGVFMKKRISRLLAILLSLLFILQANMVVFAETEPDWQDVILTQEQFEEILSQNPDNQANPRTSGLIAAYSIAISATGNDLIIVGRTICIPDVVKSGFTVVTLKRRASSTASWTTYKTYEDLYDNSSSHILSKKITVPKGYLYRVYCTHYAKKNLFSREKIDNASNVLSIE